MTTAAMIVPGVGVSQFETAGAMERRRAVLREAREAISRLQTQLDGERTALLAMSDERNVLRRKLDVERDAHEVTRRMRDAAARWDFVGGVVLGMLLIVLCAALAYWTRAPHAPRLSPETHYGAPYATATETPWPSSTPTLTPTGPTPTAVQQAWQRTACDRQCGCWNDTWISSVFDTQCDSRRSCCLAFCGCLVSRAT